MTTSVHTLFIRADAGAAIGTGHVMRMIALAQGWGGRWTVDGGRLPASGPEGPPARRDSESLEYHPRVVFICAKLPEALEARLRDEGFAVVRIDAEPGSEEDLRQTLAVVRGQVSGVRGQVSGGRSQETVNSGQEAGIDEKQSPPSSEANLQPAGRISHTSAVASAKEDIQRSEYPKNPPWLILDGYNFDYAYQRGVKQNSDLSLLCVDDHGYSDRWYCDAILNQNLDAEKRIDYQTELPDTKLLLGATFCLLRREFLQAQRPAKGWGRIQSLLVTLGGSDPDNATGAVLQLLHQACARPLNIRVLVGADNPHLKSIQAFEGHHRIEVLQGVNNMTEQYAWADGIISAGGSTCWEWLYFGLPGAIVTIADNQVPIVEALTESRRAALPLGWLNDFDSKTQGQALADWLDEPESESGRREAESLIDGYGSARVAGFLLGRKLTVREARDQDCELYFKWANDPDVRKNAFSSDPIPMEKHIRWFESRLERPESCLLLGVDFDGNPVGQIRFDYEEDRKAWVIDISTDQLCRGKGIGKQLILEGLNWMRVRLGQSLVIEADVLDSNVASIQLFQSLGFEEVRNSDGFKRFRHAFKIDIIISV